MQLPPLQYYLAHCKRIAIIAITAIVVLTVVWWGIWSLAAAQYRNVINGWIDAGRASGYQISYDEQKLFGFPRHVVLRFMNVQWKNTDNIVFHADDIDIAALPWRWNVFDTRFKHHVEIDAPIDAFGHAMILGGEDGRARVELDKDGFWKFSHITLSQASFGQTPNFIATAGSLETTVSRPEQPPQNHKEPGLTLNAQAENLMLPQMMPSPFGQQISKFALDIRIMGAVPDFRKKESTDAWNKDMGVVEFDKLDMNWGPLKMTSRGTMGFDDDLQPEGAFSASVSNHEQVLKALMEGGFIPARQEEMLNSALALYAKPSKFSSNAGIEIPMAVQLGALFFGPVRIFTFPQIDWPTANPTSDAPLVVPDQNAPLAVPAPDAVHTTTPAP